MQSFFQISLHRVVDEDGSQEALVDDVADVDGESSADATVLIPELALVPGVVLGEEIHTIRSLAGGQHIGAGALVDVQVQLCQRVDQMVRGREELVVGNPGVGGLLLALHLAVLADHLDGFQHLLAQGQVGVLYGLIDGIALDGDAPDSAVVQLVGLTAEGDATLELSLDLGEPAVDLHQISFQKLPEPSQVHEDDVDVVEDVREDQPVALLQKEADEADHEVGAVLRRRSVEGDSIDQQVAGAGAAGSQGLHQFLQIVVRIDCQGTSADGGVDDVFFHDVVLLSKIAQYVLHFCLD